VCCKAQIAGLRREQAMSEDARKQDDISADDWAAALAEQENPPVALRPPPAPTIGPPPWPNM